MRGAHTHNVGKTAGMPAGGAPLAVAEGGAGLWRLALCRPPHTLHSFKRTQHAEPQL